MTVRTRIAPSPTGAPHIGTAYIALFNYAFAKHHGGDFVLRIEDTDRTRCTAESEQAIYDALRWVGIPWSEGADIGGEYGPYRQSERLDVYKKYVAKLIDDGNAYYCFCSSERLTQLRKEQMAEKRTPGYDGHCASLDKAECEQRIAAGESYVIRMRVPEEGDCLFVDRLRGEIRIPWSQIDHQVLMKSDGFPTYHLANVVDDHLMEITHVIRGEEWISSTPKHVLLYQLFGWDAPSFIHLPLLRNPDKSKLSKRKNPTSILYYMRAGILPEALRNYLGLLAYSMPDGSESFDLEAFCESFDIDRVSLGGPIFDVEKLRSFNGRSIRALAAEDLLDHMKKWLLNDQTFLKILPLAQQRMDSMADFFPKSTFLFADELEYDKQELLNQGVESDRVATMLKIAQWEFEKMGPWTADYIQSVFSMMAEKEELKLKKLLGPFFIAVTGRKVALPLFDSMELLGRDLVLRRLQYAVDGLATVGQGLSGKKMKKLESEYKTKYA